METGCKDVEWIHLAQDTVQWRAFVSSIHSNGTLGSKKGGEFLY
jgi:hypothetical protein